MKNGSKDRKLSLKMPLDWEPATPAWISSFSKETELACMCIIGCQYKPSTDINQFVKDLEVLCLNADVCNFATCEDQGGTYQTVAIVYWLDKQSCTEWLHGEPFVSFWAYYSDQKWGAGIFREIFNIPFDRIETLFSSPTCSQGLSEVRKDVDGPIKYHGYWGGMRDRIPLSVENPFEASELNEVIEQSGNHVIVRAHENLCIIRSGQDWSNTTGRQREEYLDLIEPVLKVGMNFLRDKGEEVNCYSCRYMTQFLPFKGKQDRTFGLAFFRSLADLENWSKKHPSHKAIFDTFFDIASKYGSNLQLQLWHEVSILPAGSHYGEYINCNKKIGLLGH